MDGCYRAMFAVNQKNGHAIGYANSEQHSGMGGDERIARPRAQRMISRRGGISSQLIVKWSTGATWRNTVDKRGVRLAQGREREPARTNRLEERAKLLPVTGMISVSSQCRILPGRLRVQCTTLPRAKRVDKPGNFRERRALQPGTAF